MRRTGNTVDTPPPEGGQIMTEYIIMLALFISVCLVMVLLLSVFTEYGWRIISLVGWEYP